MPAKPWTPNELSTRIDRDRLMMVSRDEVAQTAFALLNGGREEKGEKLVAGAAVLFAAFAERAGMEPQELYRLGRSILFADDEFHHKGNVTLEALREFAGLRARNSPIV